jgi:hypothetical protein
VSARKTNAAKRTSKRRGAKSAQRAPGPTKAQLAARERIVARSGITITQKMLDDALREFLSL